MSKSSKSEIEQEIERLEKIIESAPERLAKQRDRRLTTMPAPDELIEQKREKSLMLNCSRGQARNERIGQARDGVVFILLLVAVVSVALWIYNYVQGAPS